MLAVYDEKDVLIDQSMLQFFRQLPAFSTTSTLCNTYTLASLCILNKVEGDFVECGVAAGAQIVAMDFARSKRGQKRTIHLFDSFNGIPLAGSNDEDQPGIGKKPQAAIDARTLNERLVSSGVDVFSVETVKTNLLKFNVDLSALVFHPGWFQNTLPIDTLKIDKIALLRLDGDLYESTQVCLEYLYHKVVSGGYVIIDDYALVGCAKAVHEFLVKNNLHPIIKPVIGGNGPVYWQI